MEEDPKITKIQHSKRVKIVAIGLVELKTLDVEMLQKEEEDKKETKVVCSNIIVISLIILQESAVATRNNLKKMKLELEDKSMMIRTHSW